MDLAVGAKQVFVLMNLFDQDGAPKLVDSCTYPLTALQCVRRVYTDFGVFLLGPTAAVAVETFGTTVDELSVRLGLTLGLLQEPR